MITKQQWISAALFLMVLTPAVFGLGQKSRDVTATYRDEGDTGVFFSTACVSTSWVQIISTDSIRRAIVYQTDPDLAASTVCLSSGPTNANSCGEGTVGVKLSTGAALTDYSGLNFYCRARSGTVQLTGYTTRDSGDLGSVNRPR